MAIRKYTNPREIDVSHGLQDVLRKNGMQAHISMSPDHGWQLVVLGHDSPVLNYPLSDKQVETLMNWGSTYANKKAYNTFASIVKDDFYLPQNYVSASNAFGRVAMGLHGYRIGHGEYGYDARPFIGYAPRGMGFHLRRIGGHPYIPWGGGPIVAERPDGHIKPGELASGGYGFYYKGRQQQETKVDALDTLAIEPKIKPLEAAPRPKGQGIPYSTAITSEVYFSNEQFLNVLKSHGIVIDADKKTLTIQSNLSKVDLQYDLTEDELKKLTANKASGKGGISVADRLAIINNVISKDFNTPLTKDMLETKELVSLDLKPDVRAEVEAPFIEQDRRIAAQTQMAAAVAARQQESERIRRDENAIDGHDLQELKGNKGFYRECAHGREVEVGEIRVDAQADGKYKMTAVINGQAISHEITQKQYDKFLAVDDYHRMKLFSKIFDEVDMKTRPGQGTNIGAAVLAALVATGEVLRDGVGIRHEPRPEIYETSIGPCYHKPDVVCPADVAAANFRSEEANLNVPGPDETIHRSI